MFTGIINEMGRIKSIKASQGGKRMRVECSVVLKGLKRGASISVDGACLTVESVDHDSFEAFVSEKTLEKTTLGKMNKGRKVNLERPLVMGDEMGGHMVLGHVDGVGKIRARKEVSGTYELEVAIPEDLTYGIVPEGSIAVNGVSLTIAGSRDSLVKLIIIPITHSQTNLGSLRVGELVNIEIDILGKYMYRFYKRDLHLKT